MIATEAVQKLIDKAAGAEKADDALKFSQAACNVANATSTLYAVNMVTQEALRKARESLDPEAEPN